MSDNEIDIVEMIKKSRPNIRDSTARQYALVLNKMVREFGLKSYSDFKKASEIIKHIDQNKITTKKNQITAIMVYLGINKDSNQKIIDEYNSYLRKLTDEYNKDIKENKKDDRQKAGWIEWDDVQKLRETLRKRYGDATEPYRFQKYLIICLYSIIPVVRNDYANVVIKRKPSDNKDAVNYYDVKKKKIVIGEYKTSTKDGPININLDDFPEIIPILNKWVKMNTTDHLLIDESGKKMSPNFLTKYLQKIFMKFAGKKISTTILRHSYLSHKYGKEQEDRKKDASIMGHSVEQQADYIKTK